MNSTPEQNPSRVGRSSAPPVALRQPVTLRETFRPVERELAEVEQRLAESLEAPLRLASQVAGHAVRAGGKRLRPALCLLSAQASGEIDEVTLDLAAQIELVHTVSLLHDDIVDGSDLRRGSPTANAVWGSRASLLVGDYLFSQVLGHLVNGVPKGISSVLSEAITKMALGVLMEVEHQGDFALTEAQYFELTRLKTAELMAAACRVGAMAGGASGRHVEALADYGLNLGLAYQITDDVLDFEAEPGTLGKPVYGDLREGKVTLPLIKALASASTSARREIAGLVVRVPLDTATVSQVAGHVRRHGGIARSRDEALQRAGRAVGALGRVPDGPARDALHAVARFVVGRSH